jgi:hypothetical protein
MRPISTTNYSHEIFFFKKKNYKIMTYSLNFVYRLVVFTHELVILQISIWISWYPYRSQVCCAKANLEL